ncbi:hypothetical protein RCIP0023_00321 [Klebsiella phage RCIP0023]
MKKISDLVYYEIFYKYFDRLTNTILDKPYRKYEIELLAFIGTDQQQQCQDDYILSLIRYMRFYQNDEEY